MSTPTATALNCLDTVLSWVFQTTCLVCQKFCGARPICENCSIFHLVGENLCQRCGEPTPSVIHQCGRCDGNFLQGITRCRSNFLLTENCRKVLHTIKYRKHQHLLNVFREAAQVSFSQFSTNAWVIPVPIHWKKRLERGFNQSEILADWFPSPFRVERGLLRKIHTTTPQVFLSKRERKQNQGAHYVWHHEEVPSEVLIVDDVLTTGATLEACAHTLRLAGVKSIYAWTLFRTRLHS